MESIVQASRRFKQSDFEYEKAKSEAVQYYVYPNFIKEMKEHEIPVSMDMSDRGLTSFMQLVSDPENFDKKVPTMVRLKHANRIEPNKGIKTEYLLWYENWEGTDKNGNPIPPVSDLPQGIDKTISVSRGLDNTGVPHYKKEREYWIYTVPFSKEALDKILQDTGTDPEEVQYIVNGLRSWGGFSYEEFSQLSFEELNQRGRDANVQGKVSPDKDDNPIKLNKKVKKEEK